MKSLRKATLAVLTASMLAASGATAAAAPVTNDTSSREEAQLRKLYRQAVADMEVANLNLERTEVRAVTDGYVTNLELHAGDYVQAGSPALALVDMIKAVDRHARITDIRVMPSRMVPLSAGVTSEPSFITKKTFMPPSSSTALSLNWSRKSTCLQPWASASSWAASDEA